MVQTNKLSADAANVLECQSNTSQKTVRVGPYANCRTILVVEKRSLEYLRIDQ